jgi:hypothetical protein
MLAWGWQRDGAMAEHTLAKEKGLIALPGQPSDAMVRKSLAGSGPSTKD